MFDILQYEFMRRALLVGFLLAVILPMIGIQVIVKRLALIGDAISHSALAGVAAGLATGFNPTLMTLVATITAALGIEYVRKKIPEYAEVAIAIILSTSLGIAGLLSSLIKGAVNMESFLFGSIVAIGDDELAIVIAVSFIVCIFSIAYYKELFNIAFDSRSARLQGIPVGILNTLFTIVTAISIAVASRTIGALIVSSIMIIPIATSMQFSKSYKQVLLVAIVLSIAYIMVGLVLSYYAALRPGATIVLIASGGFILVSAALAVKKMKGESVHA